MSLDPSRIIVLGAEDMALPSNCDLSLLDTSVELIIPLPTDRFDRPDNALRGRGAGVTQSCALVPIGECAALPVGDILRFPGSPAGETLSRTIRGVPGFCGGGEASLFCARLFNSGGLLLLWNSSSPLLFAFSLAEVFGRLEGLDP